MFAVSKNYQNISPFIMPFAQLWLYDLRTCSSFWKRKIQTQYDIHIEKSVWQALLKAYRIHDFSDIESVFSFAHDFHEHFQTDCSSKQKQNLRNILKRLGITKFRQLKMLHPNELQKRVNKEWHLFLRGIIQPQKTAWPWQSEPPSLIQHANLELEDRPHDSFSIALAIISAMPKDSCYRLKNLKAKLLLGDDEEKELYLSFYHQPWISKEIPWIEQLLRERLTNLSLTAPVCFVQLQFELAPPPPETQLSLFKPAAQESAWPQTFKKLQDLGFFPFQPQSLPSYLPEHSWKRKAAKTLNEASITHGHYRPWIQYQQPQPISPPDNKHFNERLHWIDEEGNLHRRDYYFSRKRRWIFQNENGEWFEQGSSP